MNGSILDIRLSFLTLVHSPRAQTMYSLTQAAHPTSLTRSDLDEPEPLPAASNQPDSKDGRNVKEDIVAGQTDQNR